MRDSFWNEAEEIAHYTVIEALADKLGDKETARLAKQIRREEERMQAFIGRQLATLAGAVIREEVPARERKPANARSTRRRSATSRSSSSSSRSSSGSSSRRSSGSRSTGSRSSGSSSSGSRSSGSRSSGSRSSSARSNGRSSSSRSRGGSRS
jgi:hypothetical protein